MEREQGRRGREREGPFSTLTLARSCSFLTPPSLSSSPCINHSTPDGDEGGRPHLISACVGSGGTLFVQHSITGDKVRREWKRENK